MRFFRKDDDAPRWVDTDALRWNPEEPLEAEPRFAPGNDVGWTQDWRSEPRAAVPDLAPPETPAPPSVPVTLLADAPEIAPANLNRAPRLGPARLAIAYEPIWAIGTGLVPTVGDVAAMHGAIRALLDPQVGTEAAAAMRLLYGGSVNGDNAAELLGAGDVDGALVGGASLTAEKFLPIVAAAATLG